MQSPQFKVTLVGDGGVGKTTWLKRLINGSLEKRYLATMGVEVHPITLSTSLGEVTFNIWDCAGQEKFGGLRDGYYIGSNAAILAFDLTARTTYHQVCMWYRDVCRVAEGIPMVLVGMKCENPDRMPSDDITFHVEKDIPYVEVSAKDGLNLFEPFIMLLQKLLGTDTFEMKGLLGGPGVTPTGPAIMPRASSSALPPSQNQSTEIMDVDIFVEGNSGVGKTAFVKRQATGEFLSEHQDHHMQEVSTQVSFCTNRGTVRVNFREHVEKAQYASSPMNSKKRSAGILMFDVTSRSTYQMIPEYHQKVMRGGGGENIPFVLVGNKVDVAEREVKAKQIVYHRKKNLQYYDVSVKSRYNIEKPVLWLLKRILNDPQLCFAESPSLAKPVNEPVAAAAAIPGLFGNPPPQQRTDPVPPNFRFSPGPSVNADAEELNSRSSLSLTSDYLSCLHLWSAQQHQCTSLHPGTTVKEIIINETFDLAHSLLSQQDTGNVSTLVMTMPTAVHLVVMGVLGNRSDEYQAQILSRLFAGILSQKRKVCWPTRASNLDEGMRVGGSERTIMRMIFESTTGNTKETLGDLLQCFAHTRRLSVDHKLPPEDVEFLVSVASEVIDPYDPVAVLLKFYLNIDV